MPAREGPAARARRELAGDLDVATLVGDQLEDRGWTVVPIVASHLDAPELLRLAFKRVARALGRRDDVQRLSEDTSWYSEAQVAAESSPPYRSAGGEAGAGVHPAGVSRAEPDVLEYVHPDVRPLVEAALDGGTEPPEIGYEVGPQRWPVEAVWPSRRLAVVPAAQEQRDAWLAEHAWTTLLANAVTAEDLIARLRGSG